MRSVKLSFLILFLIFGFSYQGYANCPSFVKSNTELEATGNKTGKGLKNFFSFNWGSLDFDEKLLKYIRVTAIKDQGIDGYFNPKIKVCDYEGEDNCYALPGGTSCRQIYGTQSTGAGVSAAVFIDWEGDKTKLGAKIAKNLEWEWADGVTEEEQKKFANSPKICACSQKGACMSGISAWGGKVFSGANIFRPGEMENVCDTCPWDKAKPNEGRQKVKCAPIPLATGPPPFCDQLAMSPPQVRVVPITNNDNDYFNPKVKVIIGNLKGKNGKIGKELDFPEKYGKENAKEPSKPIKDDKGNTYYFKTYRKKGQLCAEYHGTKSIDENKNLEFTRCFPAPPAPQPEIIKINPDGNTLEIKMKMSQETCTGQAHGSYRDNFCTFEINKRNKPIGPLSLEVVKPSLKVVDPKIVEKNNKILEKILSNNQQFKILKKYDYIPDIQVGCAGSQNFYDLKDFNEEQLKKCGFDNNRQPKIEVQYKINDKSKMFCISGWKPEPEEFVTERDGKIIELKSIGARYAKYNTVYSKESNQSYYFLCNETADLLARPQSELDEIIFNKRGYVSIPKDNEGKSCIVNKDSEMDAKQDCNKCKIVYELVDDVEHKVTCSDGDDGCICMNNEYNRSTQYVRKDKDENNKGKDEPFYLRILQKEQCGAVEPQEIPTKANRTEVFYADKLCRFDLEDLKNKLQRPIKEELEKQRKKISDDNQKSYEYSGQNKYTGNLSKYDYVEIEAWGSGEAGHIKGKAFSRESRSGIPGDYVKAKLKINPDYPIIKVEVRQGGGNREDIDTDKDGGHTLIEICDLQKQDCKPLMTIAGGGTLYRTRIHEEGLNLEKPTIITGRMSTIECSSNSSSGKPGAGGCIDKSKGGSYSKGSSGSVKIRPITKEMNASEINAAIENMVENPSDYSLIKKLDPKIIETIKEEIRKELSGV